MELTQNYNTISWNNVVKATAIFTQSTQCDGQDDKKLELKFNKINNGFYNWGHDLIELAFGTKVMIGLLKFSTLQNKSSILMKLVLYLMEDRLLCCYLEIIYIIGIHLSDIRKPLSKFNLTKTMTCESTNHFQFSTNAILKEWMRLCTYFNQFMPRLVGVWMWSCWLTV